MKKIFTLFLTIATMLSLFSCSPQAKNYEDELIGKWGCHSGGKSIIYFFEEDEDGSYTASCATSYGGSAPQIYMFDEFSASKKVITFKQDGKQTKHYYYFEDGYLYIDDLEFEKLDY